VACAAACKAPFVGLPSNETSLMVRVRDRVRVRIAFEGEKPWCGAESRAVVEPLLLMENNHTNPI